MKKLNKETIMTYLSVVMAILIVLVIRNFIIGMYHVPSGSMMPTLNIDNYVMASIVEYKISDPDRGDVVIFKYPINEKEHKKSIRYVKRLIGLPGDKIEIANNRLIINNEVIEESYIAQGSTMSDFGPITVPKDQYFMMGDNRDHSNDSRYWGFVDRKYIIAKALVVYWPKRDVKIIR